MQSLIPSPLHPAVVHLPIALAVLLPLFAIGALWAIRRGARPRMAWGVTVGMAAALLLSAWVSLQTGEQQEERVEDIVGDASLGRHEEAAELFMVMTGGVLVVAIAGLVGGRVGQAGRWLTLAGTAGVFAAGWNVGHSGGMLVYRDGAASAYANSPGTPRGDQEGAPARERERRGDEDRESDGR